MRGLHRAIMARADEALNVTDAARALRPTPVTCSEDAEVAFIPNTNVARPTCRPCHRKPGKPQ